MSSKLLPRDSAPAFQRLNFQEIAGLSTPSRQENSVSGTVPSGVPGERERLLSRIAELESELPRQVTAARNAGLREGEQSGRTHAEAAVKPVIERLCRSIQDLIEMKPRLRKELEAEAVQLALGIAKRILRREIGMDSSALQGLVQVAFERIGRQEITRVLVHPDQVAAIRSCLSQLTTREVEITGDHSREKGTLIFETTRGTLDASVDTQLREIELGLADRLKWR